MKSILPISLFLFLSGCSWYDPIVTGWEETDGIWYVNVFVHSMADEDWPTDAHIKANHRCKKLAPESIAEVAHQKVYLFMSLEDRRIRYKCSAQKS